MLIMSNILGFNSKGDARVPGSTGLIRYQIAPRCLTPAGAPELGFKRSAAVVSARIEEMERPTD